MENLLMCRICLFEDVRMHYTVNIELQETYEKLTAIPFETKGRPLQLCYMCNAKLQNCHKLRLSCLRSDNLFNEMSENNKFKPIPLQDINKLQIETTQIMHFGITPKKTDYGETIEYLDDVQVNQKDFQVNKDCALYQETSMSPGGTKDDLNTNNTYVEDDVLDSSARIIKSENNLVFEKFDIADDLGHIIEGTDPKADPESKRLNIKRLKSEDNSLSTTSGDIEEKLKFTSEVYVDNIQHETTPGEITESKVDLETGKVNYKCVMCPKYYSNKSHLKKHIYNKHTSDKRYKCHLCEKTFSQKCRFKSHVDNHNPYKCHICDKYFSRETALAIHVCSHTGEKPFKCEICNKCFTSKTYLSTHHRIHTGEKPFRCDICNRSFRGKSYFNTHIRAHKEVKTYKCNICEKTFNQKYSLNAHNRIHAGVKPYKCEVCDRRFVQKFVLLNHIRTHTGERPHKCDVCKKGFRDKNHLINHKRIHTGEKPYRCDKCEKGFITNSSLIRHVRMKH